MKERMRGWLLAVGLVAVVGMVGCSEWDSSGDESAWDDNYNWLDFSGVYSDAAMGVLIKDASVAFDLSSLLVVNESIGSGDGTSTSFSSVLAHDGVVPGSLLISAGEFALVDDASGSLIGLGSLGGSSAAVVTETVAANGLEVNSGVVPGAPIVDGTFSIAIDDAPVNLTLNDLDADGTLVSPDDSSVSGTVVYATGAWSLESPNDVLPVDTEIRLTYEQDLGSGNGDSAGSISYATGAWALNLAGTALTAGTPIRASYRYTENNSASDQAGNSGDAIYTISVFQTGDRLRIIDSNGNVYNGQLYDVNTTAGNLVAIPEADSDSDDSGAQGEIVASFIAEGPAYGQWITLEGTFVGNLISGNTLFDRHLNGTWRESGGQIGVFFRIGGQYRRAAAVG